MRLDLVHEDTLSQHVLECVREMAEEGVLYRGLKHSVSLGITQVDPLFGLFFLFCFFSHFAFNSFMATHGNDVFGIIIDFMN